MMIFMKHLVVKHFTSIMKHKIIWALFLYFVHFAEKELEQIMRTSEKYLVMIDYCLAHGRITVGEAAELLQTTRRTVLRMFHFIDSIKHHLLELRVDLFITPKDWSVKSYMDIELKESCYNNVLPRRTVGE